MPASGRQVNIIFHDNGQGLTRDALMLKDILSGAGHTVTLSAKSPFSPPMELRFAPEHASHLARKARNTASLTYRRLWKPARWDVNLFIESIDEEYLPLARLNCFLPHQEWLTEQSRALMKSVDLVLFKTHHAQELLRDDAKESMFVGFTSVDKRMPSVAREWNEALHVAGWNRQKGTSVTLSAWMAHADWPHLTVIAQTELSGTAANVRLIRRRVSDADLLTLQNRCGVHACLSEVEGFGHSLNEARSCGALTLTTDAPPMNELITPESGLLVPYERTTPMAAGIRFLITAEALADTMERLKYLSAADRQRMGDAGRAQYEAGRATFIGHLLKLVASA